MIELMVNNKRLERERNRYKNDFKYMIDYKIKAGIKYSLKNNSHGCFWESIVGYSLSDLQSHLSELFENGMNFDNFGDWHIDHKIPKCKFNYRVIGSRNLKKCWSLNNLQPMLAKDNLKKSFKDDGEKNDTSSCS